MKISRWRLEFYQKKNGGIPLMSFLDSINPKLRAKAIRDIELLEKFGNQLREPYVKKLKGTRNNKLWELRVIFGKDSARIFYFTCVNNTFVLLNGFIKKSNKTPETELEKARKYMIDYLRRKFNE